MTINSNKYRKSRNTNKKRVAHLYWLKRTSSKLVNVGCVMDNIYIYMFMQGCVYTNINRIIQKQTYANTYLRVLLCLIGKSEK